ncbi:MAG: 3-keto-5-aminohexanoate cleavage protein [Ottowia sp.]|uniref:3-keto-5-aminohexanoate cleavage protein n=1 Tax=Ottowia sp. TaxID=1898956 RepID=UPI0039E48C5A
MESAVIITCAVTGGGSGFSVNPAVPITPRQIAESALEAGRAGAAIVHLHAREPASGRPSSDLALYREAIERIREKDERLVIELTCGEGAEFIPGDQAPAVAGPGTNYRSPAQRVAHVEALRPDMCSLDMGSLSYGRGVFMNTADHLREMARRIRGAGTVPDLEILDLGHLVLARELIDEGLIEAPLSFQFVLGVKWGAPATAQTLLALKDMLPAGAHWAAAGIGPSQFSVAAQAMLLGGGVRVGLEDSLYIEPGVLARSNAQQVEKVVQLARLLGREVASPTEVRSALGLRSSSVARTADAQLKR